MPLASAMSVTDAPEASAFAIPSEAAFAAEHRNPRGLRFGVAVFLRFTLANRHATTRKHFPAAKCLIRYPVRSLTGGGTTCQSCFGTREKLPGSAHEKLPTSGRIDSVPHVAPGGMSSNAKATAANSRLARLAPWMMMPRPFLPRGMACAEANRAIL